MRIGVYVSFAVPLFLPLLSAEADQLSLRTLHHSTRLEASDNNGDGFFGAGTAIAGDVIVVGANNQGPFVFGQPSRQGEAYVYLKKGKGWKQVAELKSSHPMNGESLGSSVAISSDGNTVFAGAPDNQSGATQTAGSIYVFVKPAAGWHSMKETAKLTAPKTLFMAALISASSDGTTVVAGSEGKSSYLFVEPVGGWTDMREATATLADPSGWGAGGNGPNNYPTISGDGSTIAVGSLPGVSPYSGNVFVYEKPAGGWQGTVQLTATLLPSDSNAPPGFSDEFGVPAAVADDGSLIVTGAYDNNNIKGEAYIYAKPAGGWIDMTQTARIFPPPKVPGEQVNSVFFGAPQAIVGSTVLIGWTGLVLKNKDTQETDCICGGVFGFEEPTGGWHDTHTATLSLQPKPLVSADVDVFDFGGSFAADAGSNTAVVGAPASWYQGEPSQFFPGLSYVFDLNQPPARR